MSGETCVCVRRKQCETLTSCAAALMRATESARLMIRLIRVHGIDWCVNRHTDHRCSCCGARQEPQKGFRDDVDCFLYVRIDYLNIYWAPSCFADRRSPITNSFPVLVPVRCACSRKRAKMFRTALSAVAPRVAAANRSLLPAARRSPISALASSHQGGRSLALDCVASAATGTRSVAARKCSHRDMSSASVKVAASGSDDASTTQGGEGGDGQSEMGMGSGRDARDPLTGEGIWMDEEDEVWCAVNVCM